MYTVLTLESITEIDLNLISAIYYGSLGKVYTFGEY